MAGRVVAMHTKLMPPFVKIATNNSNGKRNVRLVIGTWKLSHAVLAIGIEL